MELIHNSYRIWVEIQRGTDRSQSVDKGKHFHMPLENMRRFIVSSVVHSTYSYMAGYKQDIVVAHKNVDSKRTQHMICWQISQCSLSYTPTDSELFEREKLVVLHWKKESQYHYVIWYINLSIRHNDRGKAEDLEGVSEMILRSDYTLIKRLHYFLYYYH